MELCIYIYIFLHFFIFRWRICGVVSVKEDLRELKTARGDMRVFNFEITDKDGGCIRVAAFNEIADKYYSIIQKGVVIYYSFLFNLRFFGSIFENNYKQNSSNMRFL